MKSIFHSILVIIMLFSFTNCEKVNLRSDSNDVAGTWQHSLEEDQGNEKQIFRPNDFHDTWPVARGREALEIKKDGEATYFSISPTDAGNIPNEGTWEWKGDQVELSIDNNTMTFELQEDEQGKKLVKQ